MMKSPAPTSRHVPGRSWPTLLAYAALVASGLLLLGAGALSMAAGAGDDWAWVGYYYAAGIAIFEVPAIVLAIVALRGSRSTAGRGRVAAALSALLVPCPMFLWGLWGLNL